MSEITQGMIVKTSAGVTGKVLRVVSAPGAVYYRLARVIVCASGRIIETAQRAFVADSEVIAFRAVPAQPVAWQGARSTAQLIESARAAFEIAMEPVEAEYAEQPAPVTVVTPAARDARFNVTVEQINEFHAVVKVDGKVVEHVSGIGAYSYAIQDVNARIDEAAERFMSR